MVEPKLHQEEATDECAANQIRIPSLVILLLPVHACSILAVASSSKLSATKVAMPVSPEGAREPLQRHVIAAIEQSCR